MVFTSKMCEKHLWKSDILSKDAGHRHWSKMINISKDISSEIWWQSLKEKDTAALVHCPKILLTNLVTTSKGREGYSPPPPL